MHGSQPKLSCVVESSVSWDLFLGCYRQDFDCDNNLNGHLRKQPKFGDTTTGSSANWLFRKWLQQFHTGDVLCHYPDLSSASDCNFPSAHDQSEAPPRSGYWHLNSMKFLQSFLRRHFAGKPVLVVKNVGCFLTVVQFSWCKVAMQLGVAMWVGTGLYVDPSSCSFSNDPFIWRQVVMGRGGISLQNVVNCLREKQKVGLAWRVTLPARREDDRIASPSWFCTLLKNATTHESNIKGGVSPKFTRIHPLGPTCMNWSPNWACDVLITARGGREGRRFPPSLRAPALAFLSRLKLPFLSLPNACHAGYTFPR